MTWKDARSFISRYKPAATVSTFPTPHGPRLQLSLVPEQALPKRVDGKAPTYFTLQFGSDEHEGQARMVARAKEHGGKKLVRMHKRKVLRVPAPADAPVPFRSVPVELVETPNALIFTLPWKAPLP